MGTAAAERSAERPGDGASPGACAVDQITPERPEERQSLARVRAELRLSRTGADRNEGSERQCLALAGQRGWYRGAAGTCLVPLAELIR